MILEVLFKGFIVGLVSALPFGPIGAFCIKKSLINKNLGGYFLGFGAASADALFAILAIFGVTVISKFFIYNEVSINAIAGIFLIFLGIKEFKTKIPLNGKISSGKKAFLKEFVSGFSLAIANPFVIFSFLALYAVLGLENLVGRYDLSALLVFSTFLGSFLGLTFLNWSVIHHKHRIKEKNLENANKLIGIILLGTGVYLMLRSLIG